MRAELFSSDFLISFFIFLSAFIIVTAYYKNLQTDIYESNIRNDMYARAINIGSMLATTSGQPEYWNSTSVQVIGLYDSDRFNLTKLEYLINHANDAGTDEINYQKARTVLGTGTYNLLIRLKFNNSDVVVQKPGTDYNYSYGAPLMNEEQVVVVKRLGVVKLWGDDASNATQVTLEVILWE